MAVQGLGASRQEYRTVEAWLIWLHRRYVPDLEAAVVFAYGKGHS